MAEWQLMQQRNQRFAIFDKTESDFREYNMNTVDARKVMREKYGLTDTQASAKLDIALSYSGLARFGEFLQAITERHGEGLANERREKLKKSDIPQKGFEEFAPVR